MHEFQSVTHAKRAVTQLGNYLLPVGLYFIEIHSLSDLFQFLFQVFEDGLVFECPFVKLFLHTNFPDGFICAVIQLSNLNVGDLLSLASPENLNYFSYFDLAVENLTHHLPLHFTVLDFLNCLHKLIKIFVENFKIFKAFLSLFKSFLLNILDQVKNLLVA